MTKPLATCFISYNHADRPIAETLRDGLQERGYRVWIDDGELRIGDSLVGAISSAIDQVDFLLALVSNASLSSNWCQKEISLAMSGEIAQHGITVLPCRVGNAIMPPTLKDKLYLDIEAHELDQAVAKLHHDMQRHLAPPQPLPPRRRANNPPPRTVTRTETHRPNLLRRYDPREPVAIIGLDTNGVGRPRNDGTPGSALYRVPFTLSTTPDATWAELFRGHWDRPPQFTTMHRPGIASVSGNRILLDGTTVEEVERTHRDTLKVVLEVTNRDRAALAAQQDQQRTREEGERAAHQQSVNDIASRLKFD